MEKVEKKWQEGKKKAQTGVLIGWGLWLRCSLLKTPKAGMFAGAEMFTSNLRWNRFVSVELAWEEVAIASVCL